MAEKKHSVHFDITAQDKASQAFAAVEKSMGKVLLASLSVGAIGTSFVAFMADAIKTRSALDDLSDTTGDNVRTLDALRRQAEVSGFEFEQLSGGLTKFARNLNAADDEGKAAAQAVEAIGLKVADLRAMKPADAMIEVARALGGFEDGASKVAVAVALMGKEGAKMLPYLKDLAEAGELNGRITAEQAAQAERTEKEWRKLTRAFKDGKDALADELIPVLGDYAEQLRKGIALTGSFGAALINLGTINPFKSLQSNIQQRQAELKLLQESADNPNIPEAFRHKNTARERELKNQIEFLQFQQRQQALKLTGPQYLDARDLQAAKKPKLDFVPTGPDKGDKSDPFAAKMAELQKLLAGTGTGADKVAAQLEATLKYDEKLSKLAQPLKERLMKVAEEIDLKKQGLEISKKQLQADEDLAALRKEAAEAQSAYQIAMRDSAEAVRKTLDPTIELEDKIREIARLVNEGWLDEFAGESAIEKLNVDFLKAQAAANNYGQAVEKSSDAARELGLTFSSAFEEAIAGGKALRDVLQGLAMDIAKIAVRKTVTEPIAAGLTGAFDKLFKPGGAEQLSGPTDGGGLMNFLGGLFKAEGGPVSRGSPYIVGERGPELFVPDSGGSIVPNDQLGGAGGGVVIHQHMTFGANVDRATLRGWAQAIKQETLAAVADARLRGGSYSRALGA